MEIMRPDLKLHLEIQGSGTPLLVLSGGPGDSCSYMKAAVQSLLEVRSAVLLDQRGTGRSELTNLWAEALQLPVLLEDLEAVRLQLGVSQLEVLGHSWGANLGLLYAAFYPNSVSKLLAIAPGPINSGFNKVAQSNYLKGFSAIDAINLAELRVQRQSALESGDLKTLQQLHQKTVTRYWVRNAIYDNQTRDAFIQTFDAKDSQPLVHRFVWQNINWDELEPKLAEITAQICVIYGYQDFEPITQAYRIKELVPQAQLEFINNCGHVPWLEQPKVFSELLQRFFITSFG
jgi:proline iminopeptidase